MKTKKQCAVCGSDKKHDPDTLRYGAGGKNYRRVGVGEGQKRQGECR